MSLVQWLWLESSYDPQMNWLVFLVSLSLLIRKV